MALVVGQALVRIDTEGITTRALDALTMAVNQFHRLGQVAYGAIFFPHGISSLVTSCASVVAAFGALFASPSCFASSAISIVSAGGRGIAWTLTMWWAIQSAVLAIE